MSTQVTYRRAIEALRAGVPNRDAVRALGCEQSAIEDRFRAQLQAAKEEAKGASPQEDLLCLVMPLRLAG